MQHRHFVYKFTSLDRMFPPNDPASQAMFRLAVLREEHLELRFLSDDTTEILVKPDPWLARSYFMRRITVSLVAIDEVLQDRALSKFIREPSPRIKALCEDAQKFRKNLRTHLEHLRDVRKKIAAHFDEDRARRILSENGTFEGPIQVSRYRTTDTLMMLPMHAAVHGCFDSATPGNSPDDKFHSFLKELRGAHDAAIFCADNLLSAFMIHHRLWG